MNERFLELAEQIPGWVSTDDGEYIGPHSSALELYAELIVRECMYVVHKKCASLTAYNALVEHFELEP